MKAVLFPPEKNGEGTPPYVWEMIIFRPPPSAGEKYFASGRFTP